MIIACTLLALGVLVASPQPLERIHTRVGTGTPKAPRDGPRPATVAGELDLFAACLASGLAPAHATQALAGVASPATHRAWSHASALLTLGVPAERAWSEAEGVQGLDQLARVLRLSDRSGAATAESVRGIAVQLRATAADESTARAERAGVLIALPLSLCFLPAFLVLGLAPVVISIGATFF